MIAPIRCGRLLTALNHRALELKSSFSRTIIVNVLQVISSRLGYYGAERVVVTLSSALQDMGVRCVVAEIINAGQAADVGVKERATELGLKTEEIISTSRIDRNLIASLGEVIDRHQIDVIHCHGIKPGLYSLLAARKRKVALVSTSHLWVIENTRDWLISAVDRVLLHSFDEVVAVSASMTPQLRSFRIHHQIVDNGIDLKPFRDSQSNLKNDRGWQGRPVIGAVGRLAAQKGLPYLLRAAPEVLRENPTALFVFAGDGPDQEALQAQANTLGIQESVRFLGVQDNIPGLLASIDVLAMPSISEGMPMALLEAMAAGKAVVASRVGAIPKVIDHGVNGWLIDSGDVNGLVTGIKEILGSENFRARLGCAARQTIESRFSAEIMAQNYLEIYREAAARKVGMKRDELLYEMSDAG
jgi:glycosyltransferase involved in cell wall biosynthesis